MTFTEFCRLNGLILTEAVMDGRIHRVPTVSHPRKKSGWYRYGLFGGRCQAFDMDAFPHDWRPDGTDATSISPEEIQRWKDMAAIERADMERMRDRAAKKARGIIEQCELMPHPYLERKGFPHARGLVLPTTNELVVPMRDASNYRNVLSIQRIDVDGGKRFLPGGQAKGAVYIMGTGDDVVLCEGYATALSIQTALKALYRQARIAVCFSAGNIANVARALQGRKVAVCDHDAHGVGQKAVEGVGLPFLLPPKQGDDFNDWALQEGACGRAHVMALSRLLTEGVC